MKQQTPEARQILAAKFRDTVRSSNRLLSPQPPNDFTPLICRVPHAMRAVRVLGAGLGFSVRVCAPLHFHTQPPIILFPFHVLVPVLVGALLLLLILLMLLSEMLQPHTKGVGGMAEATQ